jgi:hypothetical protein
MKRHTSLLLGVAVIVAASLVPEAPIARAKQILEVMVVLHMCLEVIKQK